MPPSLLRPLVLEHVFGNLRGKHGGGGEPKNLEEKEEGGIMLAKLSIYTGGRGVFWGRKGVREGEEGGER